MTASHLFFSKVQTAIEELLSVGCDIEPTSAKILFHDGFEKEGNLTNKQYLLRESFSEINVVKTFNSNKCMLLLDLFVFILMRYTT